MRMIRSLEDAFKSEDQKVPFNELLAQISKSREALQVELHTEAEAGRRRPVSASSGTCLLVNPGKVRPRSACAWGHRRGIPPETISKESAPEATGVFYGGRPASAVPDFPVASWKPSRPRSMRPAGDKAAHMAATTPVPRPLSQTRNLTIWAQERVASPVRTWPTQGADVNFCDTDRNGLPPWRPTCTDHRGTSRHPDLSLAARPRQRSTSKNHSSRGGSRPPSAY